MTFAALGPADSGSTRPRTVRLVVAIALPLAILVLACGLGWISDQVDAIGPLDRATFFWAIVTPLWLVSPIVGGFIWRRLTLRQAKLAAAVVLIVSVLAGCAAPVTPDSAVRSVRPEAPSPSPSPLAVVFDCPAGPMMGPSPRPAGGDWCPPLERAVEAAIARIGFEPLSIAISPLGIPCHDPFRVHTVGCGWYGAAVAYVTFAGSSDVAALDFPSPTGQPVTARLIAFEVPPAGWTIPRWSIP